MTMTVDDREFTQHPNIDELLGVPYIVERMEASDYAFLDRNGEPVGIERCAIGNLMQKIRSGELERQLVKCDQMFSHVVLLVEGVYDQLAGLVATYHKSREGNAMYRSRIEGSFRYADVKALMIRLSELGIELMETSSFETSMILLAVLYKQRTKPEEEHTLFKKMRKVRLPVKLSTNPAVPMLLALAPRMNERAAVNLIHEYGSVWGVLNADPKELIEVKGFGKQGLTNLYRGIGKI